MLLAAQLGVKITVDVGREHPGPGRLAPRDRAPSHLLDPDEPPLQLAVGTIQTTIDPTAAGLQLDAVATVESVTGFGLEPARLWRQLFGAGLADPVSTIDEDALATALSDAAEDLATAPVDGRIEFVDSEPVASPPEDGVAVDEPAARALLEASWLTLPRPIELPTVVDPPAIGQDELDRAMAELAQPQIGRASWRGTV